ncbi:hypothetical protein HPB47_004924 [Ixodes persulcatus]|uniref:Uncharacterized protein n=1 Tax=Ixodes persulcatus TaxID=34615 RepID=A0AC60PFK9_IXOPE|nr:hypothetical protein HPB47_004924 [Ixodes persulcatus]
MRRQCRATWCRQCRSYGHGEAECVPTYAAKTRRHADEAQDNDLLDDGESTECGTNTRPLNLPPAEPQESPSSTNTAQRETETEAIPQELGAEEMEKEKEHQNGEKECSDGASVASIGTEGAPKTDNSLTERKVPGSAPEISLGSGPPARTAAPMEESQLRREGAALKDTARTTRSSLRNPTKKTEQGSLLGPGDERVVA